MRRSTSYLRQYAMYRGSIMAVYMIRVRMMVSQVSLKVEL